MDFAIIAAGEGSRLAQEGVKWPKPLVRLNGIPLIDRLIDIFITNKASSLTIIVNEEMKEVQEHLKQKQFSIPFNLIIQSTSSSMHSFYEISKYLTGEKFCLTTVDTIFKEEDFTRYIETFNSGNTSDGLMAVTGFIDDEKPLYVNTDEELNITGFSDVFQSGNKYISGGIYCLKQSAIKVLHSAMEENISRMRNYQRKLVSEGLKLKAYPFGKIVDVDHAEDIMKAEQFLNS